MSSRDAFNCLFPLDVQNEIQLLLRFVRYSWLVCLFFFWWRIAPLVKLIGNPILDGIVFIIHLAWCVRGCKSLKRFWPYLMAFRSFISTGLSNYCIFVFVLIFFSRFMKSRVVYAASLCTFVKLVTMIWPSIRFDITLQNFKKPSDVFSLQTERKRCEEYLVITLTVKRKLWAIFLPRVHLEK